MDITIKSSKESHDFDYIKKLEEIVESSALGELKSIAVDSGEHEMLFFHAKCEGLMQEGSNIKDFDSIYDIQLNTKSYDDLKHELKVYKIYIKESNKQLEEIKRLIKSSILTVPSGSKQ